MPTYKRFVFTLTPLAALYGAILAYRQVGWQADGLSDTLKMSLLVFGLASIVTVFWGRLLLKNYSTKLRGTMAGGLSAMTLIPLPSFIGAFKDKFITQTLPFIESFTEAASYAFSTLSLAEILSIPLSIAVGLWVVGADQF